MSNPEATDYEVGQDNIRPFGLDIHNPVFVVSALTIHHLDGNAKAGLFRRIAGKLTPGGRLVAPASTLVPDSLQELARDEEHWVAAALRASVSAPVPIALRR